LPQLIRWRILGNLRQLFPEFRKAVRAKGKMPEDLDLPFSRHDIDGSLDGTNPQGWFLLPRRLLFCAYFRLILRDYTMSPLD
jgi:hypothetical protein